METFRLLIFDLDGTLIDSLGDITAAVNHVRETLGKRPLAKDTVRAYVGSGVRVLMRNVVPGVPDREFDDAMRRYLAYYEQHLLDTTVLYPGIARVLKRLEGCVKAVLTNKPERFAKSILERLGLAGQFKIIHGGDTGPQRKPDPGPVVSIMERLKSPADGTLMIGDGKNDVLAARAAGIRCAAAEYGYTSAGELKALRPDFSFGAPEDILQIAAC